MVAQNFSISRVFLFIMLLIEVCACSESGKGEDDGLAAATPPPANVRPAELAHIEYAMFPREKIRAITPEGTIEICADDWLKRSYTWEGATRSVIMRPREKRWYGSLGIYYPGLGRHWKEHNGITRGVVEEGQQHFNSVKEAIDWIHKRTWMSYVYTCDGLVVGWQKRLPREQLNVEVWQIVINGRMPSNMPGSTDAAFQFEEMPSK